MKVAFFLSGQARGIDKCWEKFMKNVIELTNCDIFISFAHDDSLDNFHKIYDPKLFTEIEFIKDPSLEYLLSIARGDVSYIKHLGRMGKDCTNLAVLRQHYFVNRANNLVKDYENRNGFKYDWVIRSRADIYVNTPISLEKKDNNRIYIPNNYGSGYNDFFAYGSSQLMDLYSRRIEAINKIPEDKFPFFNPHVELKYILNQMYKIKVVIDGMKTERERSWRGNRGERIFKYYGKLGEKERRRRQNQK